MSDPTPPPVALTKCELCDFPRPPGCGLCGVPDDGAEFDVRLPDDEPSADADLGDLTKHAMNCGWHGSYGDADCTCSLKLRVALSTERTMHRAWRKRAEQAEADLIYCKLWSADLETQRDELSAQNTRAALRPPEPTPERKPSVHDELVARLRNTPNWKREAFGGSWKDGLGEQFDRAPFEAADLIEKLDDELEAALAGILTDDFLENLRLLRLWMLGYDYDMEQIFKAIKPLVDQLPKPCTCHPDEAPKPCPRKYALTECRDAVEVGADDEALIENIAISAHSLCRVCLPNLSDGSASDRAVSAAQKQLNDNKDALRRHIAGLRAERDNTLKVGIAYSKRMNEAERALAACRDKVIEECAAIAAPYPQTGFPIMPSDRLVNRERDIIAAGIRALKTKETQSNG